jgi:V8-like Glu-specific endopeptidase
MYLKSRDYRQAAPRDPAIGRRVAADELTFSLELEGISPTAGQIEQSPNWERIMSLPLAHAPTVPLKQVSDTTTAPYRYICRIVTTGKVSHSTGVLVGPKHVLTTAHSLVDGRRIVTAIQVLVIPGDNGIDVDLPFNESNVTNIITHPDFAPGDEVTPYDFALLETERDFSKEPGFWGTPPSRLDSRGSIVGRILGWRPGKYKVNVSGYPSRVTAGQTQWHCYDDTLELSTSDLAALNTSEQQSLLFLKNAIEPGMSGSPVWVTRSASLGGRFDVAITLGMKKIRGRRLAVGRLIDREVRDFISKNTSRKLRA